MKSHTYPLSRIRPQACNHAKSAGGRKCSFSMLTPYSRPRLAKASYPEKNHRERPISSLISRWGSNCRPYSRSRPQPSGGTYRIDLGKEKGGKKSSLEQYGTDLTSKAKDGKLDPVIGRDSVR